MRGFDKAGMIGIDMVKILMQMLMVAIVALGVFGVFVISYEYYVDVRDAEARILAREVSDCLASDGVLNLDRIGKSERKNILSYCGFGKSDRFYVGVDVNFSSGDVVKLEEGDSGAIWVRDLFDKAEKVGVGLGEVSRNVDQIIKYDPGYFIFSHNVFVIDGGVLSAGEIKVEVLVKNED